MHSQADILFSEFHTKDINLYIANAEFLENGLIEISMLGLRSDDNARDKPKLVPFCRWRSVVSLVRVQPPHPLGCVVEVSHLVQGRHDILYSLCIFMCTSVTRNEANRQFPTKFAFAADLPTDLAAHRVARWPTGVCV